jgi:peptide deformylase
MMSMTVDPGELHILHYPAPALRRRARPVAEVKNSVREVAARMIELMHEADGVGLAAPQVGLDWRLFVTNGREHDPVDRVYINPDLTADRAPLVGVEEGCLSLPGINVEVRRPPGATIRALDLEGQSFERTDDGFMSRVWQHEFDHLNGVLIIDKMSPMDRIATRKALKELRAVAAQG